MAIWQSMKSKPQNFPRTTIPAMAPSIETPMADGPPPKKPKAVTDWVNKPRPERLDVTEQRRKLWEALTTFIHSNGGNVVSPPGTKRLRVELPQNSALPARLLELGYPVRAAGITTRITGGTENHGFMPVDIIEFTL